MSRGESFLENRVFSNPDEVEWAALDLQTRRDFVKHCDRGVFDPPSLVGDRLRRAALPLRQLGRVTDVGARRRARGCALRVRDARRRRAACEHDYVVNCTGFDLLAQLRGALPRAGAGRDRAQVGPIWDRQPGPRCRSAARWSSRAWRRASTSPAWPASARARASPTSAPRAARQPGAAAAAPGADQAANCAATSLQIDRSRSSW